MLRIYNIVPLRLHYNIETKINRQVFSIIKKHTNKLLVITETHRDTSISIVTRKYLKGRKPPTRSCIGADRYQLSLGSSLAMFLVRQGESNDVAAFLPIIPPITVSG